MVMNINLIHDMNNFEMIQFLANVQSSVELLNGFCYIDICKYI